MSHSNALAAAVKPRPQDDFQDDDNPYIRPWLRSKAWKLLHTCPRKTLVPIWLLQELHDPIQAMVAAHVLEAFDEQSTQAVHAYDYLERPGRQQELDRRDRRIHFTWQNNGDLDHTHRDLPFARFGYGRSFWLVTSAEQIAQKMRSTRKTVVRALRKLRLFAFCKTPDALAQAREAGFVGSFLVRPLTEPLLEAFLRRTDPLRLDEGFVELCRIRSDEEWFTSPARLLCTNRSPRRTYGDYGKHEISSVPHVRVSDLTLLACGKYHAAAILLSQLMYWTPRATQEIDGNRHVANSYRMWSAQLGLSVNVVRRAVEFLKREDLVIAALKNFGTNRTGQDRRMHHLLPNADRLGELFDRWAAPTLHFRGRVQTPRRSTCAGPNASQLGSKRLATIGLHRS